MSNLHKVLIQGFFLLGLPLLGGLLVFKLGLPGLFLYLFLGVLWSWEVFAFTHYRFSRQEEFVHVLQTAAATHAPVEALLKAYLQDRPKDDWYRVWTFCLLFFVFPGYYWVHRGRSFDSQLMLVLALLDNGVSLDRALRFVPGVVSRQTALAVTVGQFSGRLTHALEHLPDRRSASPWLELAPRLLYPLLVLAVLLSNVSFMIVFIVPKFEKIFADFRMRLPPATEFLIGAGNALSRHSWVVPNFVLVLLILFNVLLFSSRAKWYSPLLGRLYRMYARGQFLQTLGLMLESGKPLPEVLENVNGSGLLPKAIAIRSKRLADDLARGEPLAASLARHGLVSAPMHGLIVAAQNANNLPWALQELGDSLIRRNARLSYRITMVLFPLAIFACACLVAFFAVAMFTPLVGLIEGMHVK